MILATSVVIVLSVMVLVAGMTPVRSSRSLFERKHSKSKVASVVLDNNRERYLDLVISIQRTVIAVLIATIAILSVAALGWALGVVAGLMAALLFGAIAHVPFIHRISQSLYLCYEVKLLAFVARNESWLRYFRISLIDANPSTLVSSREELEHIILSADTAVITPDDRSQLQHSLSFSGKRVHECMIVRDDVPFVDKNELLGPLVLNDLHKTNYSRFIVTDSDLDHVVGVLDIQTMLRLDVKRSVTAEKAMDPRVLYVNKNESLEQALATCLESHQSLLVVVDKKGLTVGIVLLDDIIAALMGRSLQHVGDYYESPEGAARSEQSHDEAKKKPIAV